MQPIDLSTPLSLRSAFLFPLQSPLARKEILWGALLLCVPVVGWLLNMGHRIAMVRRMQQGLPAWPAWNDYRGLLRHGMITFLGIAEYHAPAVISARRRGGSIGRRCGGPRRALWIAATAAVPGYMTHYCRSLDAREISTPRSACAASPKAGKTTGMPG